MSSRTPLSQDVLSIDSLLDGVQPERLRQQIRFLVEMDKLKGVLRRTRPTGLDRYENSAEHSWQLALMAMVLSEHANEAVDSSKVMRMVLIHDIIEIDAGDTFCYDEVGRQDKAAREQLAADRIFAILPDDQGTELRALWDEFEERTTPEARFANALDRLMPLIHNICTGGGSWVEHGIERAQVAERNQPVAQSADTLGAVVESIIERGVAEGYLRP